MTTDSLTTWLGLGQAIATAVIAAYTTATEEGHVDFHSPVFWLGMAIAVFMAVKGYFTNKQGTIAVTTTTPTK
jgi:hypothetical protein